MKVLILGSSRHLEDPQKVQFAGACEALGVAFAENGISFILCSQSSHTADPHVLKGAKRQNRKDSVVLYQPSRKDKAEQGAPPLESPDAKLWKDIPIKVVEGEWRIVHLRAICDADALIAIGGSSGSTQTAIYSAELLSKPAVLIPTFGGAAQDNWGYFRGRYYSDSEAACLLQPWESHRDNTAQGIAESIRSIAKRQSRLAAKPLERAALVLSALLSVALWAYIMFAAHNFVPPPVALCLLLATSSVSGSVLRLLLRTIGAPLPIEWGDGHTVTSVVLGLLIGFGLLIVGGFAGLSLNAKMLTIDTYDDAKRIGLSFSPLLFLVALFLEQAWARLSRHGLRKISTP